MSRSARATGGALIAAALAFGALVGCASSPSPAKTSPSASETATGTDATGAAWLDGGHGAAVVSMGSSTCPPVAGDVSASGQTVTVAFAQPTGNKACTADFAPRASYLALPSGVDATKDVHIVATGAIAGKVKLSGLSTPASGGGDNAPSAGWIEDRGSEVSDGSFALLTWGSSTCPPAVGSVRAVGDGSLVVPLTVPAGTTCTMDMAPRAALAVAPATVTGNDVKVAFLGAVTGATQMLGTR